MKIFCEHIVLQFALWPLIFDRLPIVGYFIGYPYLFSIENNLTH